LGEACEKNFGREFCQPVLSGLEFLHAARELRFHEVPVCSPSFDVEYLNRRFAYHAPFGTQAQRYQGIRDAVKHLAYHIATVTPECPEQQRAFDALDMVMMLANAAIARHEMPLPAKEPKGT
jgi:hypothetical protein